MAPDSHPLLAHSVTKLGPDARGAVLVSASHGGVYAAYLAAAAGVRAVILNDAGGGLDGAGTAGLDYCQRLGMAAATVDHRTARIGSTDGMLAGTISTVNAAAAAVGCTVGLSCAAAARRLATAPLPAGEPPPYAEARTLIGRGPHGLHAWAIDSAALVRPADAGHIVITGSHGGLVGDQAKLALQVDALLALFNDAGVGLADAGIGRLAPLDARGIAAATVAAATARIGDARSTYADGVLSHVNRQAAALGARPGMSARSVIDRLLAEQGPGRAAASWTDRD